MRLAGIESSVINLEFNIKQVLLVMVLYGLVIILFNARNHMGQSSLLDY
jgi:hypothetical protein